MSSNLRSHIPSSLRHLPTFYTAILSQVTFVLIFFVCDNATAAASEPFPGATFRDCPQCPQMTVIPAGQFMMGSSDKDVERDLQEVPDRYKYSLLFIKGAAAYMAEEQPQHLVHIKHPFALSTYPITRREYAMFVEETGYSPAPGCVLGELQFHKRSTASWTQPGFTQSDYDPVVCVNWLDAQAFVGWINAKTTGQPFDKTQFLAISGPYHLPSESEWEYSARAGTTTARWWGNTVGRNNTICRTCGSVWDNKSTAPIGNFSPNAFGLSDVLGNVSQWTNDCWVDHYQPEHNDERPAFAGDCSQRVTRGGDWHSDSWTVRSASRPRGNIDHRYNMVGFRLSCRLTNNSVNTTND